MCNDDLVDDEMFVRKEQRNLSESEKYGFVVAGEAGNGEGALKDCIEKIRKYIEAHYANNINLKSIAAHFYMNPVYLGQLFRKSYHIYFNEFLLSLRMQEAKKLLRLTNLRIYEIAAKIGFQNADYFVAQFVKQEGVTPKEYRNRLLAKT